MFFKCIFVFNISKLNPFKTLCCTLLLSTIYMWKSGRRLCKS